MHSVYLLLLLSAMVYARPAVADPVKSDQNMVGDSQIKDPNSGGLSAGAQEPIRKSKVYGTSSDSGRNRSFHLESPPNPPSLRNMGLDNMEEATVNQNHLVDNLSSPRSNTLQKPDHLAVTDKYTGEGDRLGPDIAKPDVFRTPKKFRDSNDVGGQMGARRVFKMGPYGLRTSPSNKGLKKSSTSTMDSISGLRRQDTNLETHDKIKHYGLRMKSDFNPGTDAPLPLSRKGPFSLAALDLGNSSPPSIRRRLNFPSQPNVIQKSLQSDPPAESDERPVTHGSGPIRRMKSLGSGVDY